MESTIVGTETAALQRVVKLYDLAAGEERLYRLAYPNRRLVPLKIEADEEEAVFTYDLRELEPVTAMRQAMVTEKLRLLVNVGELFALGDEFSVDLSPENLYIDRNLEPKLLFRDLAGEDNRHDFAAEYRALAGDLLGTRYRFADYLHGGEDLYRKKKSLRRLADAESAAEIQGILKEEYRRESARVREEKTLVDRKTHRLLRILTPVCAALFLAGAGFAWYMNYVALPFRQSLLDANHAFLREDFDGAIDALISIPPMKMPKEERYQLARAYVVSESLSREQRRNVLSDISLMTEDHLLVYWIQLGRGEYVDAVDTAKRIGDDELLLYALVKYDVSVQMDDEMTGEAKAELLSGLGQQIEALQKKQDEKRAAVEEQTQAEKEAEQLLEAKEAAARERAEAEDEDASEESEAAEGGTDQ